jgi:Tol biopolymer transport system component/predicted Ser/Thr protein kinase
MTTIESGKVLGSYKVVRSIGVGGMGEVYMARDERLDRDVAIKMLPADFAKDEERLERFKREAKATSALNHPNILTVYDIGEQDGRPFIVEELLDGEELRDRLDDGRISIRKVIDYAQQIVNGLSAAHEKGIVHRDLKPENLFITKDDRVKILDFGLAKLREQSSANSHGPEDATRKAITDPGIVMGTAGYMSPEQVRGQTVDHRSDIFSFGVILYEMLSGKRAFHGDSAIELMNAILKEDVSDFDIGTRSIPPALDKLMRSCLEKKPEHRFHSAHDLGFALEALAAPTSSSGSDLTIAAQAVRDDSAAKTPWFGRLAWIAAGVFLISTIVLAALYFRRTEAPALTMRFAIAPPEKNTFSQSFALSPDGRQIAFVTMGVSGATSLWVRSVTSIDARPLAGTDGASFPFWSPDSRMIGFFAGSKLRKIDATGGPAQIIADASGDARGGAWAPDGTIIFAPGTTLPLLKVSSSGGPVTEVTKLDTSIGQTSHRWPSLLPDGKHILYFGRGSNIDKQGIYIASTDSEDSKFLMPSVVAASYTEADGIGYLLFVRQTTLMAQKFDSASLSLKGDATPIAPGVLSFPGEVGPTAYAAFSASSGQLLYCTGDQQTTRLTWFDRSGKSLGSIGEPAGYHEPSLSKDGSKVIYGRSENAGPQDIFLQDLNRGSVTRLTFDPAADATSLFSPDDSHVVFYSNRGGDGNFYRKPSSGAGNDELLIGGGGNIYPDDWSDDGKYLLYEKNGGPKTKVDLWVLPMTGDPTPFPYLASDFEEAHGQFSPDGHWVAYSSNESGRPEIYIQSFPIGSGKWQVSTAGGDQPQWRSDGKELFFLSLDRNLMAVPIAGGQTIELGRPEPLFQTLAPVSGITDDRNNYVPARDGQRFLINTLADTANNQPLTFVINWSAELASK